MAARAGLGHVDRIHGGTGIAGRPDIVDAVAVDADGNLGVSGGEALAVHAGVVLGQLVGAQAGVVLAHVGGIGMARSAQLRNLFAIDLALPSGLAAHGLVGIVAGGVAAMATGAGEALLRVNVLAEFLRSDSAGGPSCAGVAIQAGVHGLPVTRTCRKHEQPGQQRQSGQREPAGD